MALLSSAVLLGCVTPPRGPPLLFDSSAAAPPGFPNVRFTSADPRLTGEAMSARVRATRTRHADFEMLALSGGGAEGAFGAGVLVGLSRANARPEYDVVTGVSTGSLVAAFAFLGPEWDRQMTDAFTGGHAARLMSSRGLGVFFATSLFKDNALRALIDHYVTQGLIAAVAAEHAKGRRLLVVTTNLDTQEAVVWDMGAIASRGGSDARTLFSNILVASSSVPGVFPPVLIDVVGGGRAFEEMHVDGGATTSFFTVPEALSLWTDATGALGHSRMSVIVNGKLAASPRSTPRNTVAIAARSFDTMGKSASRRDLASAAAFSQRNGIAFQFTAIPDATETDGFLDFDTVAMRRLFDQGVALGASDQLWNAPSPDAAITVAPPVPSSEPMPGDRGAAPPPR